MDKFFDRLGDLLRSLMGSDASLRTGYDARDPDMRAALAELDAYLGSGGDSGRDSGGYGGYAAGEGWRRQEGNEHRQHQQGQWGQKEEQGEREQHRERAHGLRRDYANLEVPFAAPLEQVQKSYRRLLRQYHPDRFVRDVEKQQLATEITKRLNESFQNIRRHHRDRSREG